MGGYSVVIPTRDNAAWLPVFLHAYRKLGIEPLYIVDQRSIDDTVGVLRREGAAFIEYAPSGDFAEAMIECCSNHAHHPWILRMDDDEFPSLRMLDWIEREGIRSKGSGWMLPRRELFDVEGEIYYSNRVGRYADARDPTMISPHARLYHRNRVYYLSRVHTSGIANARSFGFAPRSAFFVHTNCLLRSRSERLAKIRRYEQIEAGSCWRFSDEYLPEIFPLESHRAARDNLQEFSELIASLPRPAEDVFTISDEERETAYRAVAAFEAEILARRSSDNRIGRHYTLDDFGWIRFIPRSLWGPLSEFLCSFGKGAMRDFGVGLWNVQDDLKHCKQWEL